MSRFLVYGVLGVCVSACLMQQPSRQSPQAVHAPAPMDREPGDPVAQSAPPAPAGPKYASFTLRNTCRQTVKVFFGDTPKFGSGTRSTIGGNSQQSESRKAGDKIWIVDDHDNGVTSHTVSADQREVAINGTCNGFEAR